MEEAMQQRSSHDELDELVDKKEAWGSSWSKKKMPVMGVNWPSMADEGGAVWSEIEGEKPWLARVWGEGIELQHTSDAPSSPEEHMQTLGNFEPTVLDNSEPSAELHVSDAVSDEPPTSCRRSSRPSKPPTNNLSLLSSSEPSSFKEAASDPRWIEAMQLKLHALEDNNTWSVVDLPPGKTPISCRWVFRIKYKATGEVERFKARLVAKGYSQREGLDYGEIFSPVAKMVTVRSVVAVAASKHSRVGDDIVIILVYVDDLLITDNNHKLLCDTRLDLQGRFKIKDLEELKFFLGIEFARSNKGILISQRKYALELISKAGLSGAKPASTPMELNQKLTIVEYDLSFRKENATTDEVLRDPGIYQRLVGKLLYLTMTRTDISFAPGLGLLMPAEDIKNLTAYCDSDWGACVQTRRLVTSYLVKFGNALVSLKSKKQSTVSRSSVEAEFKSMASCATEITWLIELYTKLGIKVSLPVKFQMSNNELGNISLGEVDVEEVQLDEMPQAPQQNRRGREKQDNVLPPPPPPPSP
uniref:Reverse transcriptase Ty1/copia-type domain-containing protein n=1 Tax=Nicotiana tabacum TaxID=4097 RepID=A0A1S3ZDF9_TOBAC|nr:PREDICTED: uncharacterized protein LOC107785615 [Nicotiana tabacum]